MKIPTLTLVLAVAALAALFVAVDRCEIAADVSSING